MTELLDPGRRAQVGALKRIFEFWTMDADFHDRYLVDPSSALAKTGLDVDPNAVSLLLLRVLPQEAAGGEDADNLPELSTIPFSRSILIKLAGLIRTFEELA